MDEKIVNLLHNLVLTDKNIIIVYTQENNFRVFVSPNFNVPNGVGLKTLKFVGKDITALTKPNAVATEYYDDVQRKYALEQAIEKFPVFNYEFSEGFKFEIITA